MIEYALKLYPPPPPPREPHWPSAHFHVYADDDAAGLALALAEHADEIADSDNAVLYEGERVVWQKAPLAI